MFELRKGENAFAKALAKIDGVTEVEHYCLVSNYGWTFKKRGYTFDVRFWENCYGAYIGEYQLFSCSAEFAKSGRKFEGTTQTADLAELLETIKRI